MSLIWSLISFFYLLQAMPLDRIVYNDPKLYKKLKIKELNRHTGTHKVSYRHFISKEYKRSTANRSLDDLVGFGY